MKIIYIDVSIIICCAISLVLFIISGFRKEITFKETFETRIGKVFFTLVKLIIINVPFYIVVWYFQNRGYRMNYPFWFMLLICSLIFKAVRKIFFRIKKESKNEKGYTKLDYVASAFLVFPSLLFIFKFVLILPDIFY
mgnify:CR=1 FL=1